MNWYHRNVSIKTLSLKPVVQTFISFVKKGHWETKYLPSELYGRGRIVKVRRSYMTLLLFVVLVESSGG